MGKIFWSGSEKLNPELLNWKMEFLFEISGSIITNFVEVIGETSLDAGL